MVDPTTSLGKVRLRIGDISDTPILPDTVINSALTDSNGNVPRAAKLAATYILAFLTSKVHRKIPQLEVWGAEQFDNYVKFVKLAILNPNLMSEAPIPYGFGDQDDNPLINFVNTWNSEYCGCNSTVSSPYGNVYGF